MYEAQALYPEVSFILVDGQPHTADYSTYETKSNTVCVLYAEEQSGFLAGYAAVKDGFTKLGFMGGMAVPAVIRFGYGFVQGADAAAVELGVGEVTIKYTYTGNFNATPEAQTTAAAWYSDGVEVIFACGGSVGNSVMAAAEAAGTYVIGVDKDQSAESETVITSAMKGVGPSVYQTITALYAGEFPGGTTLVKDASNQGVELPMATSRFLSFSQEDYDAIFAKLAADEGGIASSIIKDTDVDAADAITTTVTKVTIY